MRLRLVRTARLTLVGAGKLQPDVIITPEENKNKRVELPILQFSYKKALVKMTVANFKLGGDGGESIYT